jgi:Fic family protein
MSGKKIHIETFKAGHWEKGTGYKYFVPEPVNSEWSWTDGVLNELLENASRKLGELNSFARLVPNIDLFIHLHITKEAVLSSKIEGTQTNIGEALLPKEEIKPENRDDWQEVQNYTEAMNWGIEELKHTPISTRLMKKIHFTLMQGARGEHKQPGEFRTSQNWIGGASLSDAAFIPPSHSFVDPLIGDMENFLHNRDLHIPALIRAGIAHYQFETIHPFLDGNGRIGRLLITLFLVSEKILDKPLLYISAFFENNKSLYYDNLTNVREKSDILQWLKYFLTGIEQTASQGVTTLTNIMLLKADMEKTIHKDFGRRSASAIELMNALFKEPFVSVKQVEEICGLSKKAAGSLVGAFVEQHWLDEVTGLSRNRIFSFKPYLDLFGS